ncbi:alpha/beta fold hydrolase [Actinotalea ferrariae]|uniref:alpha/beta fold hydrolase n=1 Tax=Actinotalea ferrariae TaxID=1386098 RepID=UPI001C8B70EA|nr:alpha/beta fold hydrolase [Actinotalea ferrariae]MBX9245543.1 alpha/beta fold hydrolase [Actinotalea ferrariae]
MVTATDVTRPDGRTLEVHHTLDEHRTSARRGPVLVWHHGSPHTGRLVEPLLAGAAAHGVALVTYARPSYGRSTPQPGRDVASAADDVARVVDALGVDRFATLGHSGGGPHALACAALLPGRVTAVASISGLAPFPASAAPADVDAWFEGMASDAALRAATLGRAARAEYAEIDEFDPAAFVDRDWVALEGTWSALGTDAQQAEAAGADGLVDDDVAFVNPWGFDPAAVSVPALLVHGARDRMVPASHSRWLAEAMPQAEHRELPDDGHVSVLQAYDDVVAWLAERSA